MFKCVVFKTLFICLVMCSFVVGLILCFFRCYCLVWELMLVLMFVITL